MPRPPFVPLVLVALIMTAFAGPAFAAPRPYPPPTYLPYVDQTEDDGGGGGGQNQFRQRNAGSIRGHVINVDYRSGMMTVQNRKGRILDILVLPSTNISGRSGFQTIADISRGAQVHVIMSRRGDHFIAQIINLR
jgi:hypothetical protein